jgi:outer membrane protein OmpA-like peptidoglycan-associated protein
MSLRLHADEEHWIPLADLMTGLMMLFLLIAIAYMVAVEHQQKQPKHVLQSYQQTRAQLANQLQQTFALDFTKWGAVFDPATLAIRFPTRTVLFAPGSARLEPRFKTILRDFFPRYVAILNRPQYRSIVREVRIEGYTSSLWAPGATREESYLGNLALSQDRARNVLAYGLTLPALAPQRPWLMQVLTADGLSFSHAIRTPNGAEDATASERVEFRVRTDAQAQVNAVLASLATPAPSGIQPHVPAWVVPMIGKPLHRFFPQTSSRCIGYLDGISGMQLSGWGYDLQANLPIARVLFTDRSGTIIGGANGGLPRPDVAASLPRIPATGIGWNGFARAPGATMHALAIVHAPKTVCPLGISATL